MGQRPTAGAGCALDMALDRMKDGRFLVGPAANGFTCIHTFSHLRRLKLGLLLTFRYGFWRKGRWIPAVTDDAIHPSFVRGRKTILAGWDQWMGYHLLANDKESDAFLRAFAARHCGI